MTRFTMRLLWTVSPHFGQSAVVLALAAVFGVWNVWAVPRDVGAPYALLFFCQLFAASSGFRPAANAGYFDPALVRGVTRRQLALCHWALSSGPGFLAWAVVSGAEVCSLGTRMAMGGDPTSLAGLLVVSNIAWLTTLPSARFLGGTGWVLAMGLLGTSSWGRTWVSAVVDGTPSGDLFGVASDVAMVIAMPFLFVVPMARETTDQPLILVTATTLSLVALGLGVWWVSVRDFPGGG